MSFAYLILTECRSNSGCPFVGLASCFDGTGFLYGLLVLLKPNPDYQHFTCNQKLVCPDCMFTPKVCCGLCVVALVTNWFGFSFCFTIIIKNVFLSSIHPRLYVNLRSEYFQRQRPCRSSTSRWRARWRLTRWQMTWPSGSGSPSTPLPSSQTTQSTIGAWRVILNQSKSLTVTPASQAARSSTTALTPNRSGCCSLAFQHR